MMRRARTYRPTQMSSLRIEGGGEFSPPGDDKIREQHIEELDGEIGASEKNQGLKVRRKGRAGEGGVSPQKDSRARDEGQEVKRVREAPEWRATGDEASQKCNDGKNDEPVENPPHDLIQDDRSPHNGARYPLTLALSACTRGEGILFRQFAVQDTSPFLGNLRQQVRVFRRVVTRVSARRAEGPRWCRSLPAHTPSFSTLRDRPPAGQQGPAPWRS